MAVGALLCPTRGDSWYFNAYSCRKHLPRWRASTRLGGLGGNSRRTGGSAKRIGSFCGTAVVPLIGAILGLLTVVVCTAAYEKRALTT
jgi:hypothetical protein